MVRFIQNTRMIRKVRALWVRPSDRGQAIVLVALLLIALIAFTGIVVDGGTVLVRYAQLRRAVDAAGVQASNQFREFRPLFNSSGATASPTWQATRGGDMFSGAAQVFVAQGFVPENVRLYACLNGGSIVDNWNHAESGSSPFQNNSSPPIGVSSDPDPTDAILQPQLCTNPPRKLVRVDGRVDVGLPFLSLVGWRSISLRATSTAEAASIDIAIVLDRSASMSSESHVTSDVCSPGQNCHPFEEVRNNAALLVNRLTFPYDRVTLVTFDRVAKVYNPTTGQFEQLGSVANFTDPNFTLMMSDKNQILNTLNDNTKFNIELDSQCQGILAATPTGMDTPAYCLDTNIGGGLRTATTVLAVKGRTRGSIWMMLLLTDGAPNMTDGNWGTNFTSGFCPPQSWPPTGIFTIPGYVGQTTGQAPFANPLCRRINYTGTADFSYGQLQRACIYTDTTKCAPGTTIYDTNGLSFKYDAVDFARDQADYMSSNGIVAFTIGLGDQVTRAKNTSMATGAFPRDPRAGERLLRYVADVGTQPNTWRCSSNYWASPTPAEPPAETQCGNYWYAATGSGLQAIFDAIANRIFTRITR